MQREDRSLQSLNAESSGCPEISSAGFCWRLPPSSEGERNPHARPGALVCAAQAAGAVQVLGAVLGLILHVSWVLFCMYLGCCAVCILGLILHVSWVLCWVRLGCYFACVLGAVHTLGISYSLGAVHTTGTGLSIALCCLGSCGDARGSGADSS